MTTDRVREYVIENYLRPAAAAGQRKFVVNAGEVHARLGLKNRVPLVCNALLSKKLVERNSLRVVSKSGPKSGLSTTVTVTYEIMGSARGERFAGLMSLRGAGKEAFAALGGGEKYLQEERDSFKDAYDRRFE